MSYANRFLEKVENSKPVNESGISSITENNVKEVLGDLLEQYGHHIQSYLSLQDRRCNCDT